MGIQFWRASDILEESGVYIWELDVYSNGMTCYEIATRCLPFDGYDNLATCHAIAVDMISGVLKALRQDCPHDLEDTSQLVVGILISYRGQTSQTYARC